MSSGSNNNEPYISCIRGKHALGELVLVEDRPHVETKVEPQDYSAAPDEQQSFTATSAAITPRASTPGSSRMYRKRRKRINRRRVNSQGREWKTASASPTVLRSPSLTVAMQPELDDVEGLLFVSFSSKVIYCNVSCAHICMSAKDRFSFSVRCVFHLFIQCIENSLKMHTFLKWHSVLKISTILGAKHWKFFMFIYVTGSSRWSREGQPSQ